MTDKLTARVEPEHRRDNKSKISLLKSPSGLYFYILHCTIKAIILVSLALTWQHFLLKLCHDNKYKLNTSCMYLMEKQHFLASKTRETYVLKAFVTMKQLNA